MKEKTNMSTFYSTNNRKIATYSTKFIYEVPNKPEQSINAKHINSKSNPTRKRKLNPKMSKHLNASSWLKTRGKCQNLSFILLLATYSTEITMEKARQGLLFVVLKSSPIILK